MPTVVPEPAADSVSLVALLPSATRNASGTGDGVTLKGSFHWLVFELVVSTAVAAATLDVWVQQSLDGGVNWDDVLHFTQVTGPGAQQLQFAGYPLRQRDAGPELHDGRDATLAAGTAAVVLGRTFRVKWTIAGGIGWVFQVLAYLR